MAEIKAIETSYKGYRFRSRLEARWAVFFDALGIQWEYEKEGYDLGEAGWYLPDFWLPQIGVFAEVKPARLSRQEWDKCAALPHDCLILDGMPEMRWYAITGTLRFGCEEDGTDNLDEYLDYCSGDEFFRVDLILSKYEQRPWYSYDSNLCNEDEWTAAITAARSARFEFGESGAR